MIKKKLKPLSQTNKFKLNFLAADESNFNTLLDKIEKLYASLDDKNTYSARRPIKRFTYKDEINTDFFTDSGHSFTKLRKEVKKFFDGNIKWHSPYAAFNITSTPLLDTVAASTITQLFNPNCLWDLTSGKFILAEKKIIRLLGKKVLKSSNPDGLSTFGGKGTLLYAIKTGLGNCDQQHKKEGLSGKYAVVCSYATHFCVADVCDYVGIGSSSLIKVPLLPSGEMNYSVLESALEKAIADGKKIAAVICNGGTTIDFCMDNAKKIRKITNALEKKYNLPYKIHIHGDMVFGWAWFFTNETLLKEYECPASKKLLKIKKMLKNMIAVDSIGVDFHKMGLCPYNSSFFVVKDKKSLSHLGGTVTAQDNGMFGTNHPHYHSIENSKSGTGIISAYMALYTLGSNGFTNYLMYLMLVKEKYVELIEKKFRNIFSILNSKSLGFELVLTVSIDGQDFEKDDYIQLCDNIWYGETCPFMISQVLRYFHNGKPNPALLLYSMSPHVTEEHCLNLLTQLERECRKIITNKSSKKHSDASVFVPR